MLALFQDWDSPETRSTGIDYARSHLRTWDNSFFIDYLNVVQWHELATIQQLHQKHKAIHVALDMVGFDTGTAAAGRLLKTGRIAAYHGLRIHLERDHGGWAKVTEPEGALPKGKAISFAEFLGSGYDLEHDTVRIYNYSGNSKGGTGWDGMARALLNPPYGVRLGLRHRLGDPNHAEEETAAMQALLRQFLHDAFGVEDTRHTDHLRCVAWSTDWSTYFDPGKEWWGSFCWTVHNLEAGHVVALFASATD